MFLSVFNNLKWFNNLLLHFNHIYSLCKHLVCCLKHPHSFEEFLSKLVLSFRISKSAGDNANNFVPNYVDKVGQVVIANIAVSLSGNDLRHRLGVSDLAIDVLGHVPNAQLVPPAMGLHVFPDKACARIGFVAAHDARGKNRVVHIDVVKLDVLDRDDRDSSAIVERVQQAARVTSLMRLVLLLGSNIDCPPDGTMDLDVVVHNVGNLSTWALSSVV